MFYNLYIQWFDLALSLGERPTFRKEIQKRSLKELGAGDEWLSKFRNSSPPWTPVITEEFLVGGRGGAAVGRAASGEVVQEAAAGALPRAGFPAGRPRPARAPLGCRLCARTAGGPSARLASLPLPAGPRGHGPRDWKAPGPFLPRGRAPRPPRVALSASRKTGI